MNDNTQTYSELAKKVMVLAPDKGITISDIPSLSYIHITEHHCRMPVVYKPRIIVFLSGKKVGYLGNKTFDFGNGQCLLMALPLPCECECMASKSDPLVGFTIDLMDVSMRQMVLDLLLLMPPEKKSMECKGLGFHTISLSSRILDASARLLSHMQDSLCSKMLAAQTIREIVFYALLEAGPSAWYALAGHQSHAGSIAKILTYIELNYANNHAMENLANMAGMSVSAFHYHFKLVTGTTPLQYIKSLRLHNARLMMLNDGLKAGDAASNVGYESNSQFSREYKRHFGCAPSTHISSFREDYHWLE